MNEQNKRKAELLGVPFGTATARLRKSLLFRMAQRLGEDRCYRCGQPIETEAEFSIEHKQSWVMSKTPVETFFDPENIAFSHIHCNVAAAARPHSSGLSPREHARRYYQANRVHHDAITNEARRRRRHPA